MTKIWYVEDDGQIACMVKEYLEEKTGYKTQGKYCETKGVFCKRG